jgi:hypothetical protein
MIMSARMIARNGDAILFIGPTKHMVGNGRQMTFILNSARLVPALSPKYRRERTVV